MLEQFVACSFAKDRENVRQELRLNVIIPFHIIGCCLEATWRSKKSI